MKIGELLVEAERGLRLLRSHAVSPEQKKGVGKVEAVYETLCGNCTSSIQQSDVKEVVYQTLPRWILKANEKGKTDFARATLAIMAAISITWVE
jgi:hypothetical protein